MPLFDQSTLTQFTGTERYYRISRRHLLTDGTKYLAENAECFWMMDAVASHLMEIGTADWFVVIKTTVKHAPALSCLIGNAIAHCQRGLLGSGETLGTVPN